MARKHGTAKKTSRPVRKGGVWLGLKTWELVVIGVVLVLVAWGAWNWWQDDAAERGFLKLADAGRGDLSQVERQVDRGGGHLLGAETARYGDRFPTSGRHDPRWVNPGVYDTPQPPAKLVHSLEHGMIVVYVDQPAPGVMKTLDSWASLYGGQWSGIVVVPAAGIGDAVVLTAWSRTLTLQPFDEKAAAAFIDRYRGRGPENPVR